MQRIRISAVEIALALWIGFWVLMGYLVDRQVHGIAQLGDTVVLAGKSMRDTAGALDAASNIPFVGDQVHQLASSARRTARSAVVNGRQARSDADRLGVLLWFTLAAAPSVPAVAWYIVARRRRWLHA
jgi:hypothetical protein